MALSGTFQNLVGSNSRFGIVCYWTGTQSVPNNQTTISITVKLRYWDVEIGSRTGSYDIGGSTGSWSASSIYDYDHQYWHETTLGTASAVITHNADGTATGKTLSITYPYRGTYGGVYFDSITASTSVDLDQIPRYATVTESLSSRTETSLTVAWATDSTADKLWYSTNNGSSYTEVAIAEGTSGSYTVTGLTAGTTYQVITKVRRKDSQLESESSAGSFATYAYPYANSMPNFTLGNKVTIGIFNPLGRSVTVKMLKGTTEIGSYTTSGTSVAGFNTTAMVNALYATIPSAKSAQYKIAVVYGTIVSMIDGGTFTVKEADCKPTITGLTYQDTNATAVAITGNNQDIVRNISTVQYTATGLAGTKSATVASVQLYVNGNAYGLTVSGTTATGGNATINSGTNVTATATVTDSRGITATRQVTVTMLDWSLPSAILSINRQNNYYSETDFKVDAQYAYINGHNTIAIAYRCLREDGGGSAVTGTLQDNVTKVVTLDNNYAWVITITLLDGFGGTATYNTRISRGMPIVYYDRLNNSMGINRFPRAGKSLDINGVLALDDVENVNSDLLTNTIFHGTCTTGASTTAKVATVTGTFPSTLSVGTTVMITFSNTNSGAVTDLTLEVNSTGAKPIKYLNNSSTIDLPAKGNIQADRPITFVYDGTYWIATGFNYNTTYSSMSEAEAIAGTATSNRVITAKNLDTAIKSKFADYIVEQGNDGNNWTYVKWNSGKSECWGKITTTLTGQSWGSGTEFSGSALGYPANLFLTAPVFECSVQSDPSTIPRLWKKGTATSSPNLGAFRPDTSYIGVGVSIDFSCHAIGIWK